VSAAAEPTYDVFLVMHPFRDNVAEFQILVRPLASVEEHRHLVGAEGYYARCIDTALLALRFPERMVQRWGSRTILVLAGRTGLPMVVPSELAPAQRRHFFLDHLTRYRVYVQQYPDRNDHSSLAVRTLQNLAEHVAAMPPPSRDTHFDAARELPLHGRRQSGRYRLDSAPGF
jgi:hypothetical protein